MPTGQFRCVSSGRSLDQSKITDHLKAIAFTAGFHFAFIEQGGTSLYPSLAQRVSSPEVLRILLSIGPTETMHFQTWQDKAGNAHSSDLRPQRFNGDISGPSRFPSQRCSRPT